MGIKLAPQPFIDNAVNARGLDDFGGNTFTSGLNALIDSLNTDLDLSEQTAGYFSQVISQLLTNRLEVTQLIKDHPEIRDETISAPLIILGLPRSGTTLTHTLLALDPLSRYPRNFETTGAFCPPPALLPPEPDPRIQACHTNMEGVFAIGPQLRGINGINFMSLGTAECQNLCAHEFVHMGWSAGSSLFGHGTWVGDCDMAAAYQWHKRLLRVLQWKLPNERWVLKAPLHLFGLDRLVETYPDARIIFTHRDPFEAMMSGVSMVLNWTRITTGRANIRAIAGWYPALWAKGIEKALEIRAKLPARMVCDVFHRDLSADPLGTVERIYTHFDLPFGRAAKNRMQVWLGDNPRKNFGTHAYTAEVLELDAAKERERFAFYRSAFEL